MWEKIEMIEWEIKKGDSILFLEVVKRPLGNLAAEKYTRV